MSSAGPSSAPRSWLTWRAPRAYSRHDGSGCRSPGLVVDHGYLEDLKTFDAIPGKERFDHITRATTEQRLTDRGAGRDGRQAGARARAGHAVRGAATGALVDDLDDRAERDDVDVPPLDDRRARQQ